MDKMIDGATKLYALLGYPVGHSISPAIHNSLFAGCNRNGRYILLKIPPVDLAAAVTVLRAAFSGFNVTVPHKQAIMGHLDEMDARARMYGAVNTVKNVDGRLIGYNTDGYGFIKAFERLSIAVDGQQVLLVGSGGGARAALYELLARNCHVTVVNRTRRKAEQLQRDMAGQLPGTAEVRDWHELNDSYEFLINATSVGMHPQQEQSPVASEILSRLKHLTVVYDLIYHPFETTLLQEARRLGCQVINGYPMLFYQALAANEIWTEESIGAELSERLFGQVEQYLRNR